MKWLTDRGTIAGASMVTSLPDTSGMPEVPFDEWRAWFADAVGRVVDSTPDEGVAIFYQTDIKRDGRWIDKGYMVHAAAERAGAHLLWHKVVCRKPPGTATFGRPGYTHMQCFARELRIDIARSSADVLPGTGEMTWSRAMGAKACEFACKFILDQTTTRTVVDPFCGRGTVLAVANRMGLNAVGVELSRRRCKHARSLQL